MGGDFSWTLDPDIAATMIAAMVVGVVLTTKNFVMDWIAQLSSIVLKSSSELFYSVVFKSIRIACGEAFARKPVRPSACGEEFARKHKYPWGARNESYE